MWWIYMPCLSIIKPKLVLHNVGKMIVHDCPSPAAHEPIRLVSHIFQQISFLKRKP